MIPWSLSFRIVFQCNEKLFVLQRRSSESEVQQALKHPFLDCEHIFLISDCAESFLEFVRVVDERASGCRRTAPCLWLCLFQRCC